MMEEDKVKRLLQSITEGFKIKTTSIIDSQGSSQKLLEADCIDSNSSDFQLVQDVQAHVQETKDHIKTIIATTLEGTPLLTLTTQDIPIFQQLRSNLNLLNREIKFLLDEGILTLFLNLEQLREKVDFVQNIDLQRFIQAITQSLQKLLKKYFVYQELTNEKKKNSNDTSMDSSTSLNPLEKKGVRFVKRSDSDLFQELESMMNEKSTQQYINKYLVNEMESIRSTQETCRICSKKFKLQSIEKHVKFCEKMSVQKEKLLENKDLLRCLKKQATDLLKDLHQREKTVENESFKKLITTYLKEQLTKKEKIRPKKRSVTMFEGSTDKSLKGKWQIALFEHQDQFGPNQFFAKVLEAEIEKNELQKTILKLEKMQTHQKLSSKTSCNLENMFPSSSQSINRPSEKSESKVSSSQEIQNYDKFQKQDSINEIQTFLSLPTKKRRTSEQVLLNSDGINTAQLLNTNKRLFKKSNTNELPQNFQTDFEFLHSVSLQQISLEKDNKEISTECFQILKVLGKGAFGKVYLVRRKETEDLYALKIISISEDVTEKEIQNIKTEHQIFKKIAGDHLVKAPFSFSEKGCHIFVMELMPGGDLKNVLNEQVYFQQNVAKFYLAEIVLAIEHLHQYHIIHRDLKPQNIVLDQRGHIKLTDFGLSAMTLEKRLEKTREMEQNSNNQNKKKSKRRVAFSFKNIKGANLIGTPDYIAPEIINHISTENETIDWWSLGVIAYEFLIGTRPFSADTIEEVIQNIHDFNIDWPEEGAEEGISTVARDLIEKLLTKNFTERLGANGVEEVKKHPFFEGIEWESIKHQNAPFAPKSSHTESNILRQDIFLRKEVQQRVGSHNNTSSKLKLQKFVRYDLLGTQTIQNVSKLVSDKKQRLKKLKTSRTFDGDKKEVRFKSTSISNTDFIQL